MKQYNGWKQLQTLQTKEVLTELLDAKENRKASLIIADTGLGKTYSVDLFEQKYKQHTYRITVGDSYKLVHVVSAILRKLEITQQFRHTHVNEKLELIATKLRQIKSSGGKPIIILDEAENLKPAVLKMIKELYDAIIKYCSIVLIGTEQILDSILNRKHKNRQSVPQLWRRFKAGVRYITPFEKVRDMKPFFQEYIPGEPDVQDILIEQCENYGELHDFLEPVLRYCQKNSKPFNEQTFRLYHKLPKLRKAA